MIRQWKGTHYPADRATLLSLAVVLESGLSVLACLLTQRCLAFGMVLTVPVTETPYLSTCLTA